MAYSSGVALPDSQTKSQWFGLTNSSLRRRPTSTPVSSSDYDSGYQSEYSSSSLLYTPYANVKERNLLFTPEESPLQPAADYFLESPEDSLALALFQEHNDVKKSTSIETDSCFERNSEGFCETNRRPSDIPEQLYNNSDYPLQEYYSQLQEHGELIDLINDCFFYEKKCKSRKDLLYVPYSGQEVGETHVDFLRELGHYRNCLEIVNKICSFLNSEDLARASQVSHTWKKVIQNVPQRRVVEQRRKNDPYGKENPRFCTASKLLSQIRAATNGPSRIHLAAIGNWNQNPTSPVKQEFKVPASAISHRRVLFQEQAKKLLPCEHLQRCPRCQNPSRVTPQEHRAHCTLPRCAFDYCTKCQESFHDPSPCRHSAFSATRIKPQIKKDIIGSKNCRKNLKRL